MSHRFRGDVLEVLVFSLHSFERAHTAEVANQVGIAATNFDCSHHVQFVVRARPNDERLDVIPNSRNCDTLRQKENA